MLWINEEEEYMYFCEVGYKAAALTLYSNKKNEGIRIVNTKYIIFQKDIYLKLKTRIIDELILQKKVRIKKSGPNAAAIFCNINMVNVEGLGFVMPIDDKEDKTISDNKIHEDNIRKELMSCREYDKILDRYFNNIKYKYKNKNANDEDNCYIDGETKFIQYIFDIILDIKKSIKNNVEQEFSKYHIEYSFLYPFNLGCLTNFTDYNYYYKWEDYIKQGIDFPLEVSYSYEEFNQRHFPSIEKRFYDCFNTDHTTMVYAFKLHKDIENPYITYNLTNEKTQILKDMIDKYKKEYDLYMKKKKKYNEERKILIVANINYKS